MEKLICDCEVIHADVVDSMREKMPALAHTQALAKFYKVFGDHTRIRILYALSEHEMCVCDLAALLGMSISSISHQLRTLRQSNLVRFNRVGKVVYYTLADEHILTILRMGIDHTLEE